MVPNISGKKLPENPHLLHFFKARKQTGDLQPWHLAFLTAVVAQHLPHAARATGTHNTHTHTHKDGPPTKSQCRPQQFYSPPPRLHRCFCPCGHVPRKSAKPASDHCRPHVCSLGPFIRRLTVYSYRKSIPGLEHPINRRAAHDQSQTMQILLMNFSPLPRSSILRIFDAPRLQAEVECCSGDPAACLPCGHSGNEKYGAPPVVSRVLH
jgi:hypothetical protein